MKSTLPGVIGIARPWFGNAVTESDWDDVGRSEGDAELASAPRE